MRFLSLSFPILLAVILVFLAVSQISMYPMPPKGIPAEKYDGFSGVLTISIDKKVSDQFPTLERWLNEITKLFEKRNKGIYLRCANSQSADIVLSLAAGSAGIPLAIEPELLPAFSRSETAVPIATGGYLLAIRGDAPESLHLLPEAAVGHAQELQTVWVALCEQFSPQSTEKRTISTPDIGLIPVETPTPTLAPVTGTYFTANNIADIEPGTLFSAFLAGEIQAMPLNEQQVAKIRSRQAEGQLADVRFLNAAAYTDRIIWASLSPSNRTDAALRTEAARAFLDFMLSDAAQSKLVRCNLLPTALTAPVYEGVSGLQQIEFLLRRSDCVTGDAEISDADFAVFLAGRAPARELMRALRNRLP